MRIESLSCPCLWCGLSSVVFVNENFDLACPRLTEHKSCISMATSRDTWITMSWAGVLGIKDNVPLCTVCRPRQHERSNSSLKKVMERRLRESHSCFNYFSRPSVAMHHLRSGADDTTRMRFVPRYSHPTPKTSTAEQNMISGRLSSGHDLLKAQKTDREAYG
jgi:hypothetical protein